MSSCNYSPLKRTLDVALSAVGLIASGPLVILAAVCVKAEDGGPVLFRQRRVGLHRNEFEVYKLRTMAVGHASLKQTQDSSPGVTRVGRILRRTKVDEVPQLLNVIRGEMSLVGPRPCLPETAAGMPRWAQQRFAVRPGMTGLAQINGNASVPWLVRWEFDVSYVRDSSLALDAKILLKTVETVLVGEKRIAERPRQ